YQVSSAEYVLTLLQARQLGKTIRQKPSKDVQSFCGPLLSGNPKSQRQKKQAPDYDDWSTTGEGEFAGLIGDVLVWNPLLEDAFELSSM
ncbi:hypothetical protein KW823_27940, partial [Enterobacter quasiroggenkampii]|nr:hypothetical protein [Enterobacter quasiroggenkampii]